MATAADLAAEALPRVAVLDDYQQVALRYGPWDQLRGRAHVQVFHDHLGDADALAARLAPFEVLCLMRERTPLPADLIARLPRLRLIVTTGMANASVDIAAAQARGIPVCGTGGQHTGTPELVWLHILALARRLRAETEGLAAGAWQTGVGTDLHGRTLGLVGLGRVGTRVAAVAQAFGMRVLAWSPHLTPERAVAHGAQWVDKPTLFRLADFVVVAMQHHPSTHHLVGAQELAFMQPTAYLVNTSRGPLVDEAALLDALTGGRIAGAGLDVFDQEPLPQDHPLRSLPQVLLTPHIGYVTEATYRRFFTETVECVLAWLDGAPVRVLTPTSA